MIDIEKVKTLCEWIMKSDAVSIDSFVTQSRRVYGEIKGQHDRVALCVRFRVDDDIYDADFTEGALSDAYFDGGKTLLVTTTEGDERYLQALKLEVIRHPKAEEWRRPEVQGVKP